MKTRLLGALVGLAISLALPTFAQQKETVDPQIIQMLNAGDKKYIEAANNHDVAAIGALFTDDAIVNTDRGPVQGRQAIEKWYAGDFKGWQPKNVAHTIDSVRMLGSDNLTDSGGWTETGKGEDVTAKGYWSAVLSHQGDAWKRCVLTWNVTPAPPAPAETK
jgi:ketosteroid isomerase-like protein